MSLLNDLQIIFLFGLLLILIPIVGVFIAAIFDGRRTFLTPCLGWVERITYRIGGIDPSEEMGWKRYAKSMLLFNFCGALVLFLILILQSLLPFNPQNLPGLPWLLALNTTISFVTNTNWQAYAGEITLSYASQMWGLTVQNFLSAATGMAVLMAFIRGFVRKSTDNIGNFWADMVRIVLYLFLPLAILLSLLLVSQGVIQNLSPYMHIETLEGQQQIIPLGPAASQVAIKQLGTNGGGFFNTNSAHPFENPTPLSNFFEMAAILLIPISTLYAYGILIGSKRHARMLFYVMFALWAIGFGIAFYSEHIAFNTPSYYDVFPTPYLEGKEVRFGVDNTLLWATGTTATSSGSVNGMYSSLSPLAGGVALFNMMLGELIFGGIGVGLCSMLMFVLLTIFLSGLMVGRTPEYLGKKIDKHNIKWVMLAVLAPTALILIGTSIAFVVPTALSSISNGGPHGLSELLYAFTSAAANNGSAFAGLNANTDFYNISLSIAMLLGRFTILISCLALAGSLVVKKTAPISLGTLSTDNFLFGILLFSVILIVSALAFFPVLSLGPIVEHLLMLKGVTFPQYSITPPAG